MGTKQKNFARMKALNDVLNKFLELQRSCRRQKVVHYALTC